MSYAGDIKQEKCFDDLKLVEKCDDWKTDSTVNKGPIKCKRRCRVYRVCEKEYYRDFNYRKTWGFTEKFEGCWKSYPCDKVCDQQVYDKKAAYDGAAVVSGCSRSSKKIY